MAYETSAVATLAGCKIIRHILHAPDALKPNGFRAAVREAVRCRT